MEPGPDKRFRILSDRPGRFELALGFHPPLRWEDLLAFLARRVVDGVEEATDGAYRRSISAGGIIEVRPGRRGKHELRAVVQGIRPALLAGTVEGIRRMLDLDADPRAIARHLSRDKRMARLVRQAPGLRLVRTWDPFEAVIRAVLGQQISLAGLRTIASRLALRFGRHVRGGGSITRVFPVPSVLAAAELSGLGVPAFRIRTLAVVAGEIAAGRLRLVSSIPRDRLEKDLLAIPGIGPWSAGYVFLRGLGDPDAFPETDLGIRKALDALGYPARTEKRAEALRLLAPWRGYAAMYLWKYLSEGGEP